MILPLLLARYQSSAITSFLIKKEGIARERRSNAKNMRQVRTGEQKERKVMSNRRVRQFVRTVESSGKEREREKKRDEAE